MKRDWPGRAVHREVAENVAAFRAGTLHAPALERDLRKFFHVKKFRATQMIVAFFDVRINAADVDLRRHRGILRMLTVDVDLASELRELSLSRAKKLMHTETDR